MQSIQSRVPSSSVKLNHIFAIANKNYTATDAMTVPTTTNATTTATATKNDTVVATTSRGSRSHLV